MPGLVLVETRNRKMKRKGRVSFSMSSPMSAMKTASCTLIIFIVLVFFGPGCAYHVNPSSRGVDGAANVWGTFLACDAASRWSYGPLDKVSANRHSFTYVEFLSSTREEIDHNSFLIQDRGRLRTRRYTDIEDVVVQPDITGIILLGLTDPTVLSYVQVRYEDGSSSKFSAHRDPARACCLFPFWPFSSTLGYVHSVVAAVEELRAASEPK